MTKALFSDKKFWGSMITLALPIAVQNLLTSSFTLIDTLMVGQLGDISLAAVGMAGQWSWLLNMLTFGICSGAVMFFSQFYGEGNDSGFKHTYGIAIVSGLLCSFVFMLAGFFAPKAIISIFNRTPAVLAEGVSYLKIAVFSYPAVMLNMLVNMVLRATKRVKLPMYVSVFTTVLNAILDYALIFGAFGLPRLGVQGAAIATVISAWSGPVIIFLITAFLRDDIFYAPPKALFGFDKKFAMLFFKRAVPVIMNETLWGLGTVVYNAIFSNIGYEYSAAVSILRTFENIALAFFIGLISACSVIVGQDIGSGRIEEGYNNAKRYLIAVTAFGAIVCVTVILLREQLVGIFNLGGAISEKTLLAAKGIMVVYALELVVRNIPYASIVGIFRSGGDTKNGMKYDISCLWGISIPLTLFVAIVLKPPFLIVFICSYVFEDYIKAFLCMKHFVSKKWIKPVTQTGKAALKEYLDEKMI